jgi:hypothetical protein
MEEIFNRLIKENLSPNTYYVLHCIKEKIVPHEFVNKAIESKRLQSDHWLDDNLQLTAKSHIFMEEINSFFRKSKKKTSRDLMGDEFSQKILEFVNIFPNKKLSSGKYARVNPKNLESTFRWFFETYDYDWDTIISATEKYVDEYSLKNYEFMRTAQYFVRKQNIDKSFDSDLATYCDLLKSGYDDDNYDVFKELVV